MMNNSQHDSLEYMMMMMMLLRSLRTSTKNAPHNYEFNFHDSYFLMTDVKKLVIENEGIFVESEISCL
jgi:hypothetical protein